MRELALSYGVVPSFQEKKKSVDEFIHNALRQLSVTHDMKEEDLIVVLAGNFSNGAGFSFIEVGTVQYLKDRVSIKD
jgi:pyruvate kinase